MNSDSSYNTPTNRSRAWAGSTFFRSNVQNRSVNLISIELICTGFYESVYTTTSIPSGMMTLNVLYNDDIVETFNFQQNLTFNPQIDTTTNTVTGYYITGNGITNMRALINQDNPNIDNISYIINTSIQDVPFWSFPTSSTIPSSGSAYISMPARGTDISDQNNQDGPYLLPFNNTYLSGGNGPTSNLTFINTINTGPIGKLMIITTVEDTNGYPVTYIEYPLKVYEWSYSNNNWYHYISN